jgi:hypothetical protein
VAQGGGKHFWRYVSCWRKLTLRLCSTLCAISPRSTPQAGHDDVKAMPMAAPEGTAIKQTQRYRRSDAAMQDQPPDRLLARIAEPGHDLSARASA